MNRKHKEGKLTKAVETRTAQLPSILFLGAGLGMSALSIALMCMKKKHASLMVGQWSAPLLIMGLYDKIVKTEGHD